MQVRRARVGALLVGILGFAGALGASGRAEAQACGPICARPGHYVLCSDSFDTSAATGGEYEINLTDDLRADRICVGHAAPDASYDLRGAYVLLGPGGVYDFCAEVFQETFAAAPGAAIMTGVSTGGGRQCFGASAFSTGLSWLEIALNPQTSIVGLAVPMRFCLTTQAGSGRHTRFDADGQAGHNTINWQAQNGSGWAMAADRGVPGDFILRPIVQLSDLTPWQPGGPCDSTPADAGVVDSGGADAGAPSDAGEPADAEAADDAEVSEDAGEPTDAGTVEDAAAAEDSGGAQADAATPGDTGVFDVGGTESDSGVPGAAPSITRITPDQGLNDRETDVLVTGSGFVSGLSLKIGQILAVSVSVPGPTTIIAKVPAGIAPGVYDVLVQNPDLQAAVLPEGYTVLDPSGVGNLPEDDCGCQSVHGPSTSPWLGFGLLLLVLAARLRPAPQLARVRLARRRKTS